MVDIQNFVQENYHNNIQYLSKSHPTILQKLLAYENEIDTGNITPRYELTYEEGGFDLYDIQQQSYLYEKRSNLYTKVMQESINFSKKENAFYGFKIPNPMPKGYQKIIDIYNQHHIQEKELLKIDKFIFFGVGLGLHIEAIDVKIDAKHYFVIEDNVELFRNSLFVTPYYKIAQTKEFSFAIASQTEEFRQIGLHFLQKDFQYNQFIKFFEYIHHSEEKYNQFQTLIISQSHLNFFYSSILDQYTKPLEYLTQGYQFLNLLEPSLHTFFRSKPVLLLAPGPSLHNNINWLQKNKENFILVALSATLSTLYKSGIKPDIITHFDGFKRSTKHFDIIKDDDYFKEALFLLSARTPQEIIQRFDKERIFLFESGSNFKQGFGEMSAFCAGSSTYLLLIALQTQELYLLGLDLALDQKSLATHTKEYAYNQTLDKNQPTDFRKALVEYKGNFHAKIKTTPNFLLSIESINEVSTHLKKSDQKVYNLSDGAQLEQTIATHATMLTLPPLHKSHATLLKLFQSASQATLSDKDKTFLKEIQKYTLELYPKIKKLQKETFTTSSTFLAALIELENTICFNHEKYAEVLTLIFQNYTRFTYSFVFDIFNSKGLEAEITIQEIKQTITQTLLEVLDSFKTKLENIQ